jgi:hypothetical protein
MLINRIALYAQEQMFDSSHDNEFRRDVIDSLNALFKAGVHKGEEGRKR